MASVSPSFSSLRTYVGSLAWSPLVRLSRGFVLALLKRIEVGTVVVTDSNGAVFVCGADQSSDVGPKAELRVLKEVFWVRMLLFADMVRPNLKSMPREAGRKRNELVKAESRENPRALRKVSC